MASLNFRVSFSEIIIAFYKVVAFSSKLSFAIAKSTIYVVTNFPLRRLTKDSRGAQSAPTFIRLVATEEEGRGGDLCFGRIWGQISNAHNSKTVTAYQYGYALSIGTSSELIG